MAAVASIRSKGAKLQHAVTSHSRVVYTDLLNKSTSTANGLRGGGTVQTSTSSAITSHTCTSATMTPCSPTGDAHFRWPSRWWTAA